MLTFEMCSLGLDERADVLALLVQTWEQWYRARVREIQPFRRAARTANPKDGVAAPYVASAGEPMGVDECPSSPMTAAVALSRSASGSTVDP
jgi:hypothetical protein